MLIVNVVLGFRTGDYNGLAREYLDIRKELRELETSSSETEKQLVEKKADFAELAAQIEMFEDRLVLHVLFGVAAALVTILINCITVTYFIGTNRWCREVVDTYNLDTNFAERSIALKRQSFPWALGGIAAIFAIIFIGGAALPFGKNAVNSASWVVPHYLCALVGTGFIGWSFIVQVACIGKNFEVINEIVGKVNEIRAERGLADGPSNEGKM